MARPKKIVEKEIEVVNDTERVEAEKLETTKILETALEADKKELLELKALAEGLAKRNVVVDSRLQRLIEQLESKIS